MSAYACPEWIDNDAAPVLLPPGHQPPEVRLWADVLSAAFVDWFQYQCLGEEFDHNCPVLGSLVYRLTIRRQSLSWFASRDTGAGTFIFCCHHLNLDPAVVLGRLAVLERTIREMADRERIDFYRAYWADYIPGQRTKPKVKRIYLRGSNGAQNRTDAASIERLPQIPEIRGGGALSPD